MKINSLHALCLAFLNVFIFQIIPCFAEDQFSQIKDAQSSELITRQDGLSADVQELIELQTQLKVIENLELIEAHMVEATLRLQEDQTGGKTIAIQTEIIEQAYEVAKKKQQSKSTSSDTDKALMNALQKMLGKPESQGKEKGKKPNDQKSQGKGAGTENKGEGAPQNDTSSGERFFTIPSQGRRTVPSDSSIQGELLPLEFQSLIEDYNQTK